jgi:hypothetical protein
MSIKLPDNQRLPYFKDFELYAIWKYLNGHLTGRDVFQFEDLQAPNVSESIAANFITNFFDLNGIKFENPIFNKDIYWEFNKNDDAKESKKFLKILDHDFNVSELKSYVFLLNKYGALGHIEFSKDLAKQNRKKLISIIDYYINQFINDNLDKGDSNYLKFEVQRQKTIKLINEHKEKFGNEFVLRYKPDDSETYLFIHTIVALERLGDIQIEKAWYYDDVAPDKQISDFKIKLIVNKPKISEPNQANFSPMVMTEKGVGYFKFYKQGKKIKVGRTDSRTYKLLDCFLIAPEAAQTIDTVFKKISTKKDGSDTSLTNEYLELQRKITIIKNTLKELQKIEGLTGKVKLQFFEDNNSVKLILK